jgi:uncharacterized FlaG/YvyC family protein
MSDPIQVVPSAVPVARVTPVRVDVPAIEPPKKAQTENRKSNDHRESERQAAADADRHLTVTRDKNLQAFVYRSVDVDSGDIVWQFPAEEMLRRAEHLRQLEEKRAETAHEVDERA